MASLGRDASGDVDLFHTVATVKVPDNINFGFSDEAVELDLAGDLDHLNFRELPAGTRLGSLRNGNVLPLDVRDENGQPVQERYFALDNGELVTTRPVMPSMFTLDTKIIRQDCLGYLMERLLPK